MHPNVRYSTLRSVLQAQHTAKYRCLARVVGHRPSLVHRFCLSLRPRDNPDVGDAAQAGRAQWVYAVSLTLQVCAPPLAKMPRCGGWQETLKFYPERVCARTTTFSE